ncbi:3-dehydroquinate synthase [Sulfurospirillum arcachonense]|uniref:3-dehydroquinate synthase n=1 Tax=Sulfurospirillum arcachonense TaxID=57666 RepID=UPI0004693068|nr:3-dehydroquinate synthase [Sulfurospirillum arcachonense]
MKVNIKLDNKSTNSYLVYINELEKIELDTKVAIVTNPTVSALHVDTLLSKIKARECHVITVPDGEKYKNFETVNFILEECFTKRLDRKSILIALGGGVIGDMTGFVASIYQRGIDFIQVPTTLLAQVDASVGGKTGINNKFGKNLVGAFWQPRAVYCETNFLKTLPKREFSAGVAEIIKMAITFDKDFFQWLETNSLHVEENLQLAINKCIDIKADVVARDEREEGIRAVLNYGHTFAHVIENETKYSKYLHGEAVAIGIVMANVLASKLDLLSEEESQRITSLLKKYDLPVTYPIDSVEKFYDTFFLDKKSFNKKIKFILPHKIGNFCIKDDIKKDILLSVLGEFK